MLGSAYLFAACLLGLTLMRVQALDNGVGRLPIMGYTCALTESTVSNID